MFGRYLGLPPPTPAQRTAHRQLRRVLAVLGLLDLATVAFLVVMFLERSRGQLSSLALFAAIALGLGAVVGARVALAYRLHRRRGELFS